MSRTSGASGTREAVPARLWAMLGVMVLAQAATTIAQAAPAFLIPYLHAEQGVSLIAAGALAGAPSLGLVLALVLWGAATDRFGERRVLVVGLAATLVGLAATVAIAAAGDFSARGLVLLGVAFAVVGAVSGCTNSASGRLITGWFPADRRGLAMGIRQTCQPLGMAVAALVIPTLAAGWNVVSAIGFGGVLIAVSLGACLLVVRDPVPAKGAAVAQARVNPYTGNTTLWRIHAASMLLVVPQFALTTFGLVWFTVEFGWSAAAAGTLVAVSQLAGAAGRIAVGVWSDRAASRLRPLKLVAYAGVACLLVAAACGAANWAWAAAAAFLVASCVSVADNGLAFTAVAEISGPGWAGRALGIQNTGQFLAAAAVGPVIGAAIAFLGLPGAIALTALAPALAVPLVPPAKAERFAA